MSSEGKPLIHVAAGCLLNAKNEVLIAQRPAGKIAEGYWEFPGGKIEAGETARVALGRELHEELGVEVRSARPLIRFRHEYSNRSVILDTWLIEHFDGAPHGREGQAFKWLRREALATWPQSLPTVAPIAAALNLPTDYVFTPPQVSVAQMLAGIPQLSKDALIRLRLPDATDAEYASIAARLLAPCRQHGLKLMLDRAPELVVELGADGWHGSARALSKLKARPLPSDFLVIASAHTQAQLTSARELDCDAVVLGAVLATPTHPEQGGLGWNAFAEFATQAGLPTYAIGGVGPANHAQIFSCYGQGSAGISAYWRD